MQTILAFDLAWTGLSGWCLWNGANELDPILKYGEFKPKFKSSLTGAERVQAIGMAIGKNVLDLLTELTPTVCVYEYTDWFQDLRGKPNWKLLYKKERQNQACLHRAEMALLYAASKAGVRPVSIGATEARKEYQVQRKDAAARILSSNLPQRLDFDYDGPVWFVLDLKTGQRISDHITDAMVLADVVWHRQFIEERLR